MIGPVPTAANGAMMMIIIIIEFLFIFRTLPDIAVLHRYFFPDWDYANQIIQIDTVTYYINLLCSIHNGGPKRPLLYSNLY